MCPLLYLQPQHTAGDSPDPRPSTPPSPPKFEEQVRQRPHRTFPISLRTDCSLPSPSTPSPFPSRSHAASVRVTDSSAPHRCYGTRLTLFPASISRNSGPWHQEQTLAPRHRRLSQRLSSRNTSLSAISSPSRLTWPSELSLPGHSSPTGQLGPSLTIFTPATQFPQH